MKILSPIVGFILSILITAGCSSTKIKVINYKQAGAIEQPYLVYALPRTLVKIDVELERITKTPGPYFRYTTKYLGIDMDAVIKEQSTHWRIKNIHISSYPQPDPEHYYFVKTENTPPANFINLTGDGLIAGINTCSFQGIAPNEEQYLYLPGKVQDTNIVYTDLSVKKFITKETKTLYKRVFRDSTWVRMPVVNDEIDEKSWEEKAEEAAHFIFKQRKRHFKLLCGIADEFPNGEGMIDDKFPDGESIKFMDKELDDLEQSYLSLFLGRTAKQSYSYSFEYTPGKNDSTTIPVFAFSEQAGMLNKNNSKGKTAFIKFEPDKGYSQMNNILDKTIQNEDENEEKGIFYRIPRYVSVNIALENEIIATKRLLIAQFGTINCIPEEMLKYDNLTVEFYPQYGSIKRIGQKK